MKPRSKHELAYYESWLRAFKSMGIICVSSKNVGTLIRVWLEANVPGMTV